MCNANLLLVPSCFARGARRSDFGNMYSMGISRRLSAAFVLQRSTKNVLQRDKGR